jgi:hypothetical protein
MVLTHLKLAFFPSLLLLDEHVQIWSEDKNGRCRSESEHLKGRSCLLN